MKRFALFSCSLFLCLLVSKANPISRSQALSQAKEFLSSKGISMKTNDAAFRAPRKANAQSDENSAYYYVFNAGNDQGFVIVSGDDRTEQILGYSDSGSFDEDDVPEPLQEWLKGYEKEIDALGDLAVIPTTSAKKVIEKTKKAIPPMTTSKWGHGYPFNSKVPTINGERCTVGCVPCTVAQFLYFNRNNSVSATTAAINSSIPVSTKLDWGNMLDDYSYNTGYSTTQINAVANLMLYVGRALGASYSTSSTKASLEKISSILPKYFGYNDEIAQKDRAYYSLSEWIDVIYNELFQGRLVPMASYSTHTGHAFLIDGYDLGDLFHINWGWTGKYNGFFRLTVLNRYQTGLDSYIDDTSYNDSPFIMLYLSSQSNVSINPRTKILSGLFTSVSGTNITCKFHNQSGIDASYLLGLGYLDDNDNVHLLKYYSTSYTSLSNGASTSRIFELNESDFTNLGLNDSEYRIVPMYKLSGENEWKKCQHDIANHAIVKCGSGISSSLYSSKIDSLNVSNFEIVGNLVKGNEQTVNATITNSSKKYGYVGNVYLFASTSPTSKGSSLGSRAFSLGTNDSVVVSIPFTPSSSGEYHIWIATNSTGTNVIGQTTKNIASGTVSSLDLSAAKYSIDRNYAGKVNDKVSIWGNTFAVNFSEIKNTGSYAINTSIVAWLREYDSVSSDSWNSTRYNSYGDNAKYQYIDIVVPANSSITVPVVFENLKLNTRYDVRIELKTNNSNYRKTQPIVFLPAVTTWSADGTSKSVQPTATVNVASDVVAVDITSATAVKTINANSNPNVLYYMAASQTTPSGLTGKNVVKGTSADKITLKDNYNFVVPKTFTAKSIQFSMTPTKGAAKGSSQGWNAISLPFDVTKVMNTTDNVEIDWFHSDDDKAKNFWVRGFEYLDTEGENIVFDNSEKMLAYEPYIINVPGDYYGNKWNLTNKEITFYGENAELQPNVNLGVSSSVCNFYGTTTDIKVADSYVLNANGDSFVYKKEEQPVPAFHGYFYFKDKTYLKPSTSTTNAKLGIKFVGDEDDTTDGIMIPFAVEKDVVNVYNLNGVKVATKNVNNDSFNIDDLPKGVYVINGQKFIRY